MPSLTYFDIDGQMVDAYSTDFAFIGWNHIWRTDDLRKLALLPNLRSASFCKTTLDDVGLEHVSHVATLENLDLQDTKISNAGLAHLSKLTLLHSLRLNGNRQLTNECVPHLTRLASLTDLQIPGTAIDEHGLASLDGMTNLRNITVELRDSNFTFNFLQALSARMNECVIRADGRGEFFRGEFHGQWQMTEQEWLNTSDSREMLEHLRGNADSRKARLFAVACCRQIWSRLRREELRNAVRAAEEFADGHIDQTALTQARRAALAVFQDPNGDDNSAAAALSAANTPAQPDSSTGDWWEDEFDRGDPLAPALLTSRHVARAAADERGQPRASERSGMVAEYRKQSAIIRCIFGNPFQLFAVDPRWRTSDAVGLARAIYEDRAFERMPILADALMDAGCEDDQIIGHCRSDGVHVRGCWVVDLVLDKK